MEQWYREHQLVQDRRTGEVVRLSSVTDTACCGQLQHPVMSTPGYRVFVEDDRPHLRVLSWAEFTTLRASARNGG